MVDCAAGSVICGTVCVSILTDAYNCGECGSVCPNSGGNTIAFSSAGACGINSACPSGLTNCGGFCYNLSVDAYNCGGCLMRCPAIGSGGLAACSAGKCVSIAAISSSSPTSSPTISINSTS